MSRSSREALAGSDTATVDLTNDSVVMQGTRTNLALIVPDYLSSSLVMLTLTASWFFELLGILDTLNYYRPTDLQIKTVYPLGITLFSASSTALAKAIDYRYPDANAMSHLLILPSTSIVFFLIRLMSNITNYPTISLPAFIAISSIAIPASAALLSKFDAPDIKKNSDPYYFGPLSAYQPPAYADFHPGESPTKIDRIANTVRTSWYCISTATVFFWALNRELSADGKTTPMYEWQYCATIFFLLMSGMMGYVLTEKTKAGQAFIAANKMIESGACIYEATGSLTNLIYTYRCPDYQFCADERTQKILSWIFFWLVTLPLGLFVAASTRFDFQTCDHTNQKIKKMANAAKEKAEEASIMLGLAACDAKTMCGNAKQTMLGLRDTLWRGCGELYNKTRTSLRDCFYTVRERTRCRDTDTEDPAATTLINK